MKHNTQCKWISFTNGDNAYGSEVVDRILNSRTQPFSKKQADMLLAPLDSRNYADQGKNIAFNIFEYDKISFIYKFNV